MLRPASFAALLLLAGCTSPDAPQPDGDAASASAPADAPGDLGGPGACHLDVLSFDAAPGDAAAGNGSVNVTVRNLGAGTCLLRGFPTVALLGADGDPLDVETESSTGTYFLQEQTVQPVLVPPSATAFFQLAYRSAPTDGETCPAATRLVIATEINEPDLSGTPAEIAVQMAPCGEAVRVSAFREGTYTPTVIEEVTPEPGL